MAPPEESGPRRRFLGCGRTLAGAPGHCPSLVGCCVCLGRVYAWPRFDVWVGFCWFPLCKICFTFLELRLLSCFPLVFKYMSCKTWLFQYIWDYVNNKCICVISLFISPVLDLNWRSDLIVKNCQQPTHSSYIYILIISLWWMKWWWINSFYSTNQIQKVRSEKMMDHSIPQTKHTLSY
jgi:hypothetical protein